jgi:hypothetical protein
MATAPTRSRSTALARATVALAAATACTEGPAAPPDRKASVDDLQAGVGAIATDARGLYSCYTVTRGRNRNSEPFLVTGSRFAYSASALDARGAARRRTLVVTGDNNDTLSVTNCAVPATAAGDRVADVLFARVSDLTTSATVQRTRAGGRTTLRLAASPQRSAQRSAAQFVVPVCTIQGECATLAPRRSDVSLSAMPGGGNDPWGIPDDPCEYDYFYGCAFSQPNGGGGGANSWEPDVIDGSPAEAGVQFICNNGVTNGTCLRELSNAEAALFINTMTLVKPTDQLALVSQACKNAAFMVQYYYDHGRILAGTNGPDGNGFRHAAQYGTDQTPGSPTYGLTVIHIDYAILAAVQGVYTLNGIRYDMRDLANILLHEGMHAWTNMGTYSHPDPDTIPSTSEGFRDVPYRSSDPNSRPGSLCVQ